MKIGDQIIKIISETKFAPAPVTEAADLYLDLSFDSLAFVTLLVKIEEAYSITFDLLEMRQCLRVGRLIALVKKKVRESEHDSSVINQSAQSGKDCGH
ncbi:MAG: acyl carrier protein [Firmicutes bacterium]|nr:acyl carrier protein [Bacillota bacterium]